MTTNGADRGLWNNDFRQVEKHCDRSVPDRYK